MGGFRASMAVRGGEMRGELVCHDEDDVWFLGVGLFCFCHGGGLSLVVKG